MKNEFILQIAGVYSLGFAIFHGFFWRLFDWKTRLPKSGRINSSVTQILNLALMYFAGAVALLCFSFPEELVGTPLGRAILGGISLFWLARLAAQFIFLRFHHWANYLLSVLFGIGAVLFALPVFR